MIVLIFKKTIVFSFNLHVRRVAAHGDFVRYRRSAARPAPGAQLPNSCPAPAGHAARPARRAPWPFAFRGGCGCVSDQEGPEKNEHKSAFSLAAV